jgi:iron complex outermembrane receptor protein
VRTDGIRATAYTQSFTTPWLALSLTIGTQGMVYASWGQGIESDVAPNRSALHQRRPGPARAAQPAGVEAGLQAPPPDARLDRRGLRHPAPRVGRRRRCDDAVTCTRVADGRTRHRGVEGDAEWRAGAWSLRGSALWLHARREQSQQAGLNGLQPTNVPSHSVKAQAAYNVAALPGLALLGFVTHEGRRMVLPDNSVQTPGWTRLDLAARFTQKVAATTVVWRAGVDNLADTRAWKESPYQFGHAYLYHCSRARSVSRPRSRSESCHVRRAILQGCSPIAQLVERRTVNP